MVSFEIFDIIDQCLYRPNQKVPKIPLWALKGCFALVCAGSMSHVIFGAWFIHEAGLVYNIMTVIIAFILSVAFFYESDGRCWKEFATLCVICAIPRIFFWPVYSVAKQTSAVNGTDLLQHFHHENIWGYTNDETLRSTSWVYYYNLILIFSTIQRVSLRIVIELKKQKVYAENLKIEETKRNELAVDSVHI